MGFFLSFVVLLLLFLSSFSFIPVHSFLLPLVAHKLIVIHGFSVFDYKTDASAKRIFIFANINRNFEVFPQFYQVTNR